MCLHVKLRLVARSLGIILASPLVALPTWLASDRGLLEGGLVQNGFAQERAPSVEPPAAAAKSPEGARPKVAAPAEETVVPSKNAMPPPSPVEVSVTCGRSGCVVLEGLAVTVIESEH